MFVAPPHIGIKKRTDKMVPYACELDEFCKVGVAQHLTTHRLATYTALIDRHFFCAGIDGDDPR